MLRMAVLMRLRADLRTGWRALLGLALLLGLVGGVALTAVSPQATVALPVVLLAVPLATLLLANLIAAVPGRVAARSRPATVPRTE